MADRNSHWFVPATVLLSLTAGALFALGHHLFYSHLDGQAVGGQDYNFLGTWSKQQANLFVGVLFSQLVNFSLGSALAMAYAQVFWRAVLRRKTTLERLDATFSGLTDIMALLKFWIWASYPLLFLLALISWLLPIASNITPGTLSVGTAPVSPKPTLQQQVPNVGFESLNYVNSMPHESSQEDSRTIFNYNGPSIATQRVATDVLATGLIQRISMQHPNASWTLNFTGPGLSCTDVPQSLRTHTEDQLISNLKPGAACVTTGYIAWKDNDVPLSSNVTLSFNELNQGSIALNLVAFPHMMQVNKNLSIHEPGETIAYLYACDAQKETTAWREHILADATMMQCQLRNVTYHVGFQFTNGQQNIAVTTETDSDSPINAVSSVIGIGTQYNDFRGGVDCTILANEHGTCSVDPTLLRTLSYQAIFDAFESVLDGTVTRQDTYGPEADSSIQNTVLVDTPELGFLKPDAPGLAAGGVDFLPLQGYITANQNLTNFRGLVNEEATARFGPLSQTIEQLFQNVTVSMMSANVLQPNLTSAFAPQPATVTLNNFHNVYVYAAAKLWIAYGLAIGFTALTAIVGLWTLLTSGVSYSDEFSTIFRVAHGATMSVELTPEDMSGTSPLPERLRKAEVWLSPSAAGAAGGYSPLPGSHKEGDSSDP